MRKFLTAGCFSLLLAIPAAAEVNTYGPHPDLPQPEGGWFPTVNVAPASAWPKDGAPRPAKGFKVNAFARDLHHPRWLYVLPNGDVLVAETNTPSEPIKGIADWVTRMVMARAGAGMKSPNQIVLLRDTNGDGIADKRTVFIKGLYSPFGMVLVGNTLYVADTDAVLMFPYRDGETSITAEPKKLVDLPAGNIDYHWTKNIVASADGTKLFVSVGSDSNFGDNGMENEKGRAAIWEIDRTTGKHRIYASGMRNPVGMSFQPETGALWASVNERDELGDNLPPDYMTEVKDGGFYGWPYSYWGKHVDDRVKPQRPDLVANALTPDYALGAHTASLGLTFYTGTLFGPHYRGGAFVGQHGSWNRSTHAGYKVIFVAFKNGKPDGMPEDMLTGFLNSDGEAQGRPVCVTVAKDGALLVADDVGNTVWRLTPGK
ncbi:MAG TPA: sorbosone dehydrogenase family protein [Rhizomicrobium sp.]|nr:sorbosone dehydrogenase family protein [Rhizomicrobium sp.]